LDVQELARTFTEQAVLALVEALKDPRHKVAAAEALLNRAWGRPVTPVVSDGDGADHWSQHLLAARLVAAELRLERAALETTVPPLIEGPGSEASEPQPRNLPEPALE
jgi:hypothetical protein